MSIEYNGNTDINEVRLSPIMVPCGQRAIVIAIVRPDGTSVRIDGSLWHAVKDVSSEEFYRQFLMPAMRSLQARLYPSSPEPRPLGTGDAPLPDGDAGSGTGAS